MFGLNIDPKLIIIGVIISVIAFKFYDMNNTIHTQSLVIEKLKSDVETKKADIAHYKTKLSVLEQSNKDLVAQLDKMSKEYAKYKDSAAKAKKALDEWRKKEKRRKLDEVRHKVNPNNIDMSKATCEEGLRLNRMISELRYDML